MNVLLPPVIVLEKIFSLEDVGTPLERKSIANINRLKGYNVTKASNRRFKNRKGSTQSDYLGNYHWVYNGRKLDLCGKIREAKVYKPEQGYTVHSLRKLNKGIVSILSYKRKMSKKRGVVNEIILRMDAINCPYWKINGFSKILNGSKSNEPLKSGFTHGKNAEIWYAGILGISPGMRHDRSIRPFEGCRMGWDMEWLWMPGKIDGICSKIFMACVSCLDCGHLVSFNNKESCEYNNKLLEKYNLANGKRSSFIHTVNGERVRKSLVCKIVNCSNETELVIRLFRYLTLHFPAYINAHNGLGADNKQCARVLSDNIGSYNFDQIGLDMKNVTYKKWSNPTNGVWLDFPGSDSLDSYIFTLRVLMFKYNSLSALSKKFGWSDKMEFKDFSIPTGTKGFADMMTYCAKDAFLHAKAIDGLNMPQIYSSMVELTGCLKKDVICWNTGNIIESMLAKMAYERKEYIEWSSPIPSIYSNVGGRSLYNRAGLFRLVVSMDLTSAYPMVMALMNICPSTLEIIETYDEAPLHTKMNLWEEDGYTYCYLVRALVRWKNNDNNLLGNVVRKLLVMRKNIKGQIKLKKMEMGETKEMNQRKSLGGEISVLEGTSMCIKILANTIYGWQSSEHCSFGGKVLAELITFLAGLCLDCMGLAAKSMGWIIVAGDTDSIFMIVDERDRDCENPFKLKRNRVELYLSCYEYECRRMGLEPVELTIENYFPNVDIIDRMILLSKKHYAISSEKKVIYKGLKPVRRDSTKAEIILDKLYSEICLFMNVNDVSESLYYVKSVLNKSLNSGEAKVGHLMRKGNSKGRKILFIKSIDGPLRIPMEQDQKFDKMEFSYDPHEYVKQFDKCYKKFSEAVDVEFDKRVRNLDSLGEIYLPVFKKELETMESYSEFLEFVGGAG